ncbi:hypothetical protein [Spiroplasma endosymbiont of Virgichneumon dumeticola]|uniref:hypothetical protein n=1 Tax=Spiroplasma endosymbiont of Virgichneumon dumeticola TaxID=3139323 RepID=UPI0035C8BC3F
MKLKNHHQIAWIYIISFLTIIILTTLILLSTKILINTSYLLTLMFLIIMIIFNVSFFYLPFCFKKFKYPLINLEITEKKILNFIKPKYLWTIIIPSLISLISVLIIMFTIVISHNNLLNVYKILFLIGFWIVVCVINCSYLLVCIKFIVIINQKSKLILLLKEKNKEKKYD